MKKNIDYIVFFLHLVKSKSFSTAARSYGISNAAATRWIKNLEELLGVALIKRNTRTLNVTEVGLLLAKEFSKIHGNIEDLIATITSYSKQHMGVVKIASTPLFANSSLKYILSDYFKVHNNVDFILNITPFDVDLFEYDFAIKAEAKHFLSQSNNIDVIKKVIASSRLKLCASPAYIKKHGEPLHPSELIRHKCIFSRSLTKGEKQWMFEVDGAINYLKISKTIECDSAEMLYFFALEGIGIAYLPDFLIKDSLLTGKLIEVLPDFTNNSFFDFVLLYKPDKFRAFKINQIIDAIMKNTVNI